MEYGSKVKQSDADKLVGKLPLAPGETALFAGKCSNWSPPADWLVVTTDRVIASPAFAARVAWAASRTDLVSALGDAQKQTLTLGLATGETFAVKKVSVEDQTVLLTCLDLPTEATAPESTPEGTKPSPSLAERLQTFGQEVKDAMADPLPGGHDPALHGAVFRKVQIGRRTYEFYERGFVRASGGGRFERLVGVNYRETTTTVAQDASVVGGFLTNVVSLGLVSTENIKRQTTGTITVTTESNDYSGDIKAKDGRLLEAFVARVIPKENASPVVVSQAAPEVTAAEKLRQIADLHRDGILSDDEFAAAKAKLLDQI